MLPFAWGWMLSRSQTVGPLLSSEPPTGVVSVDPARGQMCPQFTAGQADACRDPGPSPRPLGLRAPAFLSGTLLPRHLCLHGPYQSVSVMLSLSFPTVLKAPPGGQVPGSSMLVNFDQGTLHSTEEGSLGNEDFLGSADNQSCAYSDISPVSAPGSVWRVQHVAVSGF